MICETQSELNQEEHCEGLFFRCGDCGEVKPVRTDGGTGYGYENRKPTARPICYDCCGKRDRERMIEEGRAALYLTCQPATSRAATHGRRNAEGTVSNWPGTLSFPCYTRTGNHNIAGVRYDCWFTGPDGYEWHGVTYGENTQICHCKRTKNKAN